MNGEVLLYSRLSIERHFYNPVQHYSGDAGFDLACSEGRRIPPKSRVEIGTNIAVALPHGYWAMIMGRSSAFHKLGLIVTTGVIDQGYRGELIASVFNTNEEFDVIVNEGDRLVQLILFPLVTPQLLEVVNLPDSPRGSKGFGSTGK